MEAYLRAALKAEIDEAWFWRSTPYNVQMRVNERSRAAGEAAMATGWWAERFAREERLSSLSHYLKPAEASGADDGDALIASLAMMHGLAVDDVDVDDGRPDAVASPQT